jgi:peptidyl-prolyl cis-trans isomerase B (cyclophilin B)
MEIVMKKWLVITMIFTMVLMTACQGSKGKVETPASSESSGTEVAKTGVGPTATITVKGFGDIIVELDPTAAPNTVKNFMSLSNDGFYDGLIFHRIISGFMIQGGDPKGDGTGDPGYGIKGEFASNGVENPIKHVKGVISMARSAEPDSAGSQFFIMHGDADYLDGEYAAFGRVISGLDIVDKIAAVKTAAGDRPETDVVIEKITLDAKGFDFSGLVKIEAK